MSHILPLHSSSPLQMCHWLPLASRIKMKPLNMTFRVLAWPTSSLPLKPEFISSFPLSSLQWLCWLFSRSQPTIQAVRPLSILFPVSGMLFGSHLNHSLVTVSVVQMPHDQLPPLEATATWEQSSELNAIFINLIIWLTMPIYFSTGRSTWASYTLVFSHYYILSASPCAFHLGKLMNL